MNPLVGKDALGAILFQKGKISHYLRPIYSARRVKLAGERSYSKLDIIMSVVYACRRFHQYLVPHPFVFLRSYSFLLQMINGTNLSTKAVMKWIIELHEFTFAFLVEESTKATLADLLTYRQSPFLIKETMVQKPTVELKYLDRAYLLFFDRSYRKSHDKLGSFWTQKRAF